MAFTYNPATNRLEDENGNPAPPEGVPLADMPGAAPAAPVAPTGAPIRLDPNEGVPMDQVARQAPASAPPLITRPNGTASGRPAAPAVGGPTVTTHVGGVSLEQPIGAEGVIQRTSGGSTVTHTRQTAKEAGIEKEIAANDAAAQENAAKAADLGRQHAIAESARADEANKIATERAAATKAAMDAGEKEIARKESIAADEEAHWRQAAADATDSRNTFWARQDTGYKIKSGISLLLGVVGGLTDGSNVGAERINKAIDQDAQRYKDKLDVQEKILDRSRGNVTAAKQRVKEQREAIDIRSAVALDAVASQAEATARRLGIDDAQIKGNQGIIDLRAAAADKRANWQKDLRDKVSIESARTVTTSSPGGGADKMLHANTEDTDKLANAANALKGFDSAMAAVKENKNGWNEYRKATVDQQRADAMAGTKSGGEVLGLMRGTGLAPMSAEERMKSASPQAKQIATSFNQAIESIAKAAGGVITESDRQSAQKQLALAAVSTPEEAMKILEREKQKMLTKVNLSLANKRYNLPEGVLPSYVQQGGGAAAPAAAGAGRRTTVNGKPAMVYPDGTYDFVQ